MHSKDQIEVLEKPHRETKLEITLPKPTPKLP